MRRLFPFIWWSPLPLYPASIVKWLRSLFSPMMHLEKHIFPLLRPVIFTFFLLIPSSFLILFLHVADLKLTPEGVRWPRRSNAVTQPQLVSSFHPVLPPPRSSTLMMPVKGFLPNLSALMFASVLSLTGEKKSLNKGKIIKEWVIERREKNHRVLCMCAFDGFRHE